MSKYEPSGLLQWKPGSCLHHTNEGTHPDGMAPHRFSEGFGISGGGKPLAATREDAGAEAAASKHPPPDRGGCSALE